MEVFCTDGEPAELAAGSISKSIFPSLLAVWRCMLHSGQRSQELAIKSCEKANHLLQELVCRFSENNGEAFGGLARALHNSPKLRSRFREVEARDLDELASLTWCGSIHCSKCYRAEA